jgi:predicted MFS family arabinose efflux permease
VVVSDLFPQEKRGRVLGVFYLAIPVGTALGYLIGGYLGPRYGWRTPFYVSAIPGFLLALCLLFVPEPEPGRFDSIPLTPERGTLLGLMRNPAFWTATLGMAAMTFSLGGLQVWMPTFLSRARGYSLRSANQLFGLIIAFDGTVASLSGGWLGDRLLRRWKGSYYLVSAASMAVGVPVMMLALFNRGPLMVPAILGGGFLLLLNTAPLNAALLNSVDARIRATSIAVNILVIHLLGDALSPWLIGFIADRGSLEDGFVSAIVAMAISSAILFYGMRFAPSIHAGSPSQAGALPG